MDGTQRRHRLELPWKGIISNGCVLQLNNNPIQPKPIHGSFCWGKRIYQDAIYHCLLLPAIGRGRRLFRPGFHLPGPADWKPINGTLRKTTKSQEGVQESVRSWGERGGTSRDQGETFERKSQGSCQKVRKHWMHGREGLPDSSRLENGLRIYKCPNRWRGVALRFRWNALFVHERKHHDRLVRNFSNWTKKLILRWEVYRCRIDKYLY